MGDSQIAGFGGFMYKHYLQVMPNAKYPYASCAFFNLISTNADAYKVWGEDVGDYPSLPSINVDRTQFGNGTFDGDLPSPRRRLAMPPSSRASTIRLRLGGLIKAERC
jgi:hypothetical protein